MSSIQKIVNREEGSFGVEIIDIRILFLTLMLLSHSAFLKMVCYEI